MEQALQEIDKIERYSVFIDKNPLMEPTMATDSIMLRLIRLAEHIKNISIKFKENHNEIPWAEISGFRNRIVHDYGETDYRVVYDIIEIDIPRLKEVFEATLGTAV